MSKWQNVEEEDVLYDLAERRAVGIRKERRAIAESRQLTGQERRSQAARYQRRRGPACLSGAHRRGGKRSS